MLRGIDDEHWPLVRQVVMEAESFDMVRDIRAILEPRGFRVEAAAAERVGASTVSSEVSHVWAWRPAAGGAAAAAGSRREKAA